MDRTILLPRLRPMVVAVVFNVFSKALAPADFFFLELEDLLVDFVFSRSRASLALRFSSASASSFARFSSCFRSSTRSS